MLLLAIAVGVLAVVATLASNDVKSAADVPLLFANANGAIVTAFILGVVMSGPEPAVEDVRRQPAAGM